MAIRIVKLGSPREENEGLRLGTVRRPPRGVKKTDFAIRDFYDIWLPTLSPSQALVAEARAIETDRGWAGFKRRFRAELDKSDGAAVVDLLAVLSHRMNLSLGCYCDDERRCHRSILREMLLERGADLVA